MFTRHGRDICPIFRYLVNIDIDNCLRQQHDILGKVKSFAQNAKRPNYENAYY